MHNLSRLKEKHIYDIQKHLFSYENFTYYEEHDKGNTKPEYFVFQGQMSNFQITQKVIYIYKYTIYINVLYIYNICIIALHLIEVYSLKLVERL